MYNVNENLNVNPNVLCSCQCERESVNVAVIVPAVRAKRLKPKALNVQVELIALRYMMRKQFREYVTIMLATIESPTVPGSGYVYIYNMQLLYMCRYMDMDRFAQAAPLGRRRNLVTKQFCYVDR